MTVTTTTPLDDVNHLSLRLSKEIVEYPIVPDIEKSMDLLQHLKNIKINMIVLEKTKIGKLLAKANKTLKRHKRTATDTEESQGLDKMIAMSTKLLNEWKSTTEKEAKSAAAKRKVQQKEDANRPGLPKTVAEYRARLVSQKKDLYKDPPVLPPLNIVIESKKCPPPKRDEKTGELTFVAGENKDIQAQLKEFHPNRTPEEVLRSGAFGGTYFRPITSAVTNVHYTSQDVLKDTFPKEWVEGLSMSWLTSSTYRTQINKYGVNCGGSLGMWESSGWITECDPYGWFQWYCRFYQGRRCSDDARQISRWLKSAGPKGRFRSQLCNKILAANAKFDDRTISPVIRQTLLHWGLEITPEGLEKHRKRVGK
jgi:hypothetical protein